MLDRAIADAVAQRAAVILKLSFRKYLQLSYGKTNCVDGRMGWAMTYVQPKSDYEGEPDDWEIAEHVFADDKTAAEGYTAQAKRLLGVP